jgi:nitrate reductase delta subunit
MERARIVYDMFGRLLAYPGEGFALRVLQEQERLAEFVRTSPHGEHSKCVVAESIAAFLAQAGALEPGEMEELYTRTFDINPVASLELGWHLYGEQYERGAFMVKMRQMLHAHFIMEEVELPDHLTHILQLLGRLEKEEADRFALTYVVPALDKIQAGFAEVENPYKHLLEALSFFVRRKHGAKSPTIPEGAVSHE